MIIRYTIMSTVFEGKVRRLGNSMAVIILKEILEETGAREGDVVKFSVPIPKQRRKAAFKKIAIMTSLPIRDQVNDHLLTPKNTALVIIDYQPTQVNCIASMDRQLLIDNIVRVARLGKAYGLPIVLSTVNVNTGFSKPTIPQLKEVLPGLVEYDRTTINSWEDKEFLEAMEATGRKKLIMCALWTEACLIFPSLDALRDGYEVYPVVDAVGGTSVVAHETALERIALAGGKPVSWVQLACELQRDWARQDTVQAFRQILFDPSSPVYENEHREQLSFGTPPA